MAKDNAFTVWDETTPSGRDHKGFQIRFSNGYTVSLTWGMRGLYGDGKSTAEAAVILPNGQFENEDVIGWQTPEQVLEIMNRVAAL